MCRVNAFVGCSCNTGSAGNNLMFRYLLRPLPQLEDITEQLGALNEKMASAHKAREQSEQEVNSTPVCACLCENGVFSNRDIHKDNF